jgi:hypothetical protein
MGHPQHTPPTNAPARAGRFRRRICLRKGCGRLFVPRRRHDERFCREPECQRELVRWQASERQRRSRSCPENRRKHAEAERRRRQERPERCHARKNRCSSNPTTPPTVDGSTQRPEPSTVEVCSHPAAVDAPTVDAPSVGDAPANPVPPPDPPPRAWSRRRRSCGNSCQRPGCYEPVRPSCRAPARYCSEQCRAAVQRVRDRERKHKRRKAKPRRMRRRPRAGSLRAKRRRLFPERTTERNAVPDRDVARHSASSHDVRDYSGLPEGSLSCGETTQEVPEDDREMSAGGRPRAPPSR